MATARALRLAVLRITSPVTKDGSILLAARRRLLSVGSTESSGAGNTAVHSGDPPSDDYVDRPPRFSGADAEEATTRAGGRVVGKHPVEAEERVPPFAPSGKKKPPLARGSEHSLADPAVAGASFTQKRRLSSSSSSRDPLEEAATPGGGSESAARKVREEDREYYKTHKPSPLAEVEFADTRKPITRATDGGDRYYADDVPGRVVEDTVDDSLARAEALFREAKARGNPEWPHSRALAEMLARRREMAKEKEKDAAGAGSGQPCWGS